MSPQRHAACNDAEVELAFFPGSSLLMQQRITGQRDLEKDLLKVYFRKRQAMLRKPPTLWNLGSEKIKEIKGRVLPKEWADFQPVEL